MRMPVRDLLAFDCQTSASTEFSLFHDTALQDCGGRHKPVAGEPDAGRVNQMTQREAWVAYHGRTVTGPRVCLGPSPHIKSATVKWGGLGRSTAQVKTPLRLPPRDARPPRRCPGRVGTGRAAPGGGGGGGG